LLLLLSHLLYVLLLLPQPLHCGLQLLCIGILPAAPSVCEGMRTQGPLSIAEKLA